MLPNFKLHSRRERPSADRNCTPLPTRFLRLFHVIKFFFDLRGEVRTRSQIPPILHYATGDDGDAGGAGRVSGGGG